MDGRGKVVEHLRKSIYVLIIIAIDEVEGNGLRQLRVPSWGEGARSWGAGGRLSVRASASSCLLVHLSTDRVHLSLVQECLRQSS